MNPLWLLLLLPLAATIGLIIGSMLSSGAYTRGYHDGHKLGQITNGRGGTSIPGRAASSSQEKSR